MKTFAPLTIIALFLATLDVATVALAAPAPALVKTPAAATTTTVAEAQCWMGRCGFAWKREENERDLVKFAPAATATPAEAK
jgi:hypothetical protein